MQMPNFFTCGPIAGTKRENTASTSYDAPAAHPTNKAGTYSSTAGEHFEASKQRVLNFVDGFMSPFKACVVPPLQACVAPDDGRVWDPACGSDTSPAAAIRCTSHSYEFPLCGADVNIADNSSKGAVASSSRTLQPNPNDVLLGRGRNSCQHPGNTNFRKLVAANRPTYAHLTKKQKMMVARQIVDIIHHTDPPGRFLARENGSSKTGSPLSSSSSSSAYWVDVGLPRSLEKTSQALRDRHSSTSETTNDCSTHGDDDHPMEGVTTTRGSPERKRRSRVVEVPEIIIPLELAGIYRLPRPSDAYRDRSAPHYAHAIASQPPPPYSTHHHHHRPYPINPHPQYPAANASRMPPTSSSPYPGEAAAVSSIPPSYRSQGRPYYASDQRPQQQHQGGNNRAAASLPLQPIPQVTPSRDAHYASSATTSASTKMTTTHHVYPGGAFHRHQQQQEQTPSWKRQRTVDPQVVTSTSAAAAAAAAPKQQQSHLTHAMQSCRLSMEERVVAPPAQQHDQSVLREPIPLISPSSLLSARRNRSRLRRTQDNNGHDMDGLAALSTAAFLRLDDDDDEESNF